jgi:glutathione S-transferase
VLLEDTHGGEKNTFYTCRVIERHLAKKFGFFGTNEAEEWAIEEITEYIHQLIKTYYAITKILDYNDRHKAAERFLLKELPEHFTILNKYATTHGSSDHFVGDSLSLADLKLFALGESLGGEFAERFAGALANYNLLTAIYSTVANNPVSRNFGRGIFSKK